ncbi:MAG: peptidase M28 family protein [Alphaproteobacteria bacterium]|nr:MAG: peptidase M28 family protein [Alphaproteobacteria bacterium]
MVLPPALARPGDEPPAKAVEPAPPIAPALAARAADLRERARHSDLAWRLVSDLTTRIGPRLAGSPAEERARTLMAETLKRLGFVNVSVEEFPLPGWRRGEEAAAIISPAPQPLAVTALGGSVATPAGGITASVVRFADLAELEAAPANSLKGRIAFVDQRMFRAQDGSSYGQTVAIRVRSASIAAAKGAVAVLIRSVGTDSHRLPHTGMMRYADDAAKIPAAALANPDADQLARLLAIGDEPVVVQLTLTPKTGFLARSGNVVADIPGTDRAEEIVLLGAHLDSWDLGTGAIDDGAGVAIVTAAAKLVAEEGRPRRTLRVVLFGSEEVGLVGARAYLKAHEKEIARHVMVSEADFGADRVWRMSTGIGRRALPFAAALHHLLRPLGIGRGGNDSLGGSDVSVLARAGVPAIGLNQDGMRYFDLHHTADDTLDKIDPHQLAQSVAAWATTAFLVANSDADLRAGGLPARHGE